MKIRAALAAFCAGWALMMMEILGGRLMAPWFGQSVQQWGALIGCIMTAMAAGYWFGGRTKTPGKTAGACLAFGGLWAAATPALGKGLLALCALLGQEAGMVVGAAALMAAPAFALAAVSPACVAALAGPLDAAGEGAGRAAGRVGALGSVGSIGGTFFAAFIAVPAFGVASSYVAAALIAAAGALAAGYRPDFHITALAGLLAVGGLAAERDHAGRLLLSLETVYNSIEVTEQDGVVTLTAGGYGVVQSKMRRDGAPTGMYYDALPALPALSAGGDGPRVLVLGVAGGSGLTAIAKAWPQAEVLGVELDPGMTMAGRAHFDLRAPVIHDDARRFVETDDRTYDVVLTDVYSGGTVPFHAASQEYFQGVARHMAPGGVAAVNACRCGGGDALPGALAATMGAVFPSVLAAETPGGNVALLAWREPGIDLAAARARLAAARGVAAAGLIAQTLHAPPAGFPVLTDDRSDVEFRTRR